MPSRCVVPLCKGNYENGPKVHTFGFPKDIDLCNKWIQHIKRVHFKPSKYSRVCELHFEKHDIEKETSFFVEATGEKLTASLKQPRLRKGAIPSRIPEGPENLLEKKRYSQILKALTVNVAQDEADENHVEQTLPENFTLTSLTYVPYSEPSCGVHIKQEPDEDSCSQNEYSSPSIKHSSSLNHPPFGVQIKQEPNQDFYSSKEVSLPSISHSFSLTAIEFPGLPVCSTSADECNSFETRLDLLFRNWKEKMKMLPPDQRIYAEKLIDNVFSEAELGHLRQDVTLTSQAKKE